MSHMWAYAAAVVLVAIGGVGASYYYFYGVNQPTIQTTPVTVHVSGMTSEGAIAISGVHVTATYGGQSFTGITDIHGQTSFNIPINTHVVLTDDLSGYKTVDTISSSMFVPIFH